MKRDNTKQNPTNETQLGNEALEGLSGGTQYLGVMPYSSGPQSFPELYRRRPEEPKEGGATYTW